MAKKKLPRFSERLRRLMENKGIGQQKLADAVGLSQGAISHYLNGTHEPEDLSVLLKMAEFFRVTLYDLTGLESLKGIEKEAAGIEPTEEEVAMLERLRKLPPDDPRRIAVEALLLSDPKEGKEK